MSGKLLSYSGITTKSKAMESKLIKDDGYRKLSEMTSVNEFVLYFKSHEAYQPFFAGLNENAVHRGQIEMVLKNSLYDSFAKLYRFANKKQREILKLVFFHYEVLMLKSCLQKLFSPEIKLNLGVYREIFKEHSSLRLIELENARNLEEFTNVLSGTEYYPLFVRMLNSTHKSLFDLEMQLDVYYYKALWKRKNKVLKGKEQEVLTRAIGTRIDVANIMMIYRSKKYYALEPADILAVIIPISYKLKQHELMNMINASSISEFTNVLQASNYRIEKENLNQDDMERAYFEAIFLAYQYSKIKFPVSIAPILNYLYLKELELDNLTTLLECIRYGLDSDHILQLIIKI
ncbi:V-type ATPase subunit [Lachnoclostridium phytofermentans]|uniref:V-type ATPase subunit n=1 Tax=Lachnoclostridium phytofermentans TaxID=66219 RepID=UPI000495537E|nr:V-type ATPase subunit [Lachnoclostridium phytofermentans]